MFKKVDPGANFPKMEEETLSFWKKNKIFEKSIEQRSIDKRWTFLDGPPFVTGTPHYGSLLSSIPKDVFGRYWTMKGYRVRRVWGWDGHGLPIENKVEGKLNIERKKDIEDKIGVDKFIEECKKYVSEVSGEWEWYIDHIGRWVDFKNAYKTWDIPYMESVMWVFKQMYEKKHIYKGLRVQLYCPHDATPISNFEVAMDNSYKDVEDFGTTYKYKLREEDNTYILAWSTTPWNKIVTPALAVNPDLLYVKVKQGSDFYILAKTTLKMLKDDPVSEVVDEFVGASLIGKKFEPHYDYYEIKSGEKAFEIIGGDFVTAEEGTGVVTIAAYGEEDLKVMKEQNVHIETHVDEEGVIRSNVPIFGGMYYLKANKAVNEDLEKRGLIYRDEKIMHSVPHCWRCGTRLYFAPLDAWFVDVKALKPLLKETNEAVNWFPAHFKYGRFLKSLESAPDWNISRNRYWGSPVPVWECECGERFVPGSISELEEASGIKITDLHKPFIDQVTVICKACGKKVFRVPEVLDTWIEAGSASFAERHFPFNAEEKLEDFFPPDFIAEYTGQIRAWFYVVHVIGAALYKSEAFKNVVVEGVILGTDGRKMSKNYGNYPDPKGLIEKYGGDALRLYLMGAPVMHGEDVIISEDAYRDKVRGLMLVLWNVYNFFVSYALIDGWGKSDKGEKSVLDKWILSRENRLIREVTEALDSYDTVKSIALFESFVNDLSTWYVRRSRGRVGSSENIEDKSAFYTTIYEVLTTLVKLIAPLAPFISEEIYRNLTNEESVHLADWPKADESLIDVRLEEEMSFARQIVEVAHAKRKEAGMKVRQPLKKITYTSSKKLNSEIEKIIADELNVKEVVYERSGVKATDESEIKVDLDTNLTPELEAEGEFRDLIRKIQDERKKLGTGLNERIDVLLPAWPESFTEEIKKRALIDNLSMGEFKVTRKNA